MSPKKESIKILIRTFSRRNFRIDRTAGSGRTELALSIFGKTKPDQGEILINGQPVKINSIQDALRYGIAYVPKID
jgi:simple sugar transport system ATP-binding protein